MTLHYIEHYLADHHRATLATKVLGTQPLFHEGVFIKDCHIGEWTEVGANSWLVESTLDNYSYTAGDNQIIYSRIGKFSNIASHVRINPGNHPMERVTLHHITYRRSMYGLGADDTEFFEWRRAHECVIGHDTWLGHNVIIMPGVSVGTGAVVGSGAVVTKDVEPYTIVVGVPAKTVRKRFPDRTIEKLLQIAWWDWDRDTLEARFDDLYDINLFIEKYQS
ncbi:MAG: acetyltransferase [Anaerolineae bacterium]|nr:acetyltransferase [Anaerolineae bacterium]